MDFGKAVLEIRKAEKIRIISHYDCDGLCSATILKKALEREGKEFSIEIAKQVDNELISKLENAEEDLLVFSDLGSGYLELLEKLDKKIIVLDHHQPSKERPSKNIEHINPILESKILCGAGIAFLLATKLDLSNKELVDLAIVGAIGDNQVFEGENKNLVAYAKRLGRIKIQKGLNVFGWVNRPLHKALVYSNIHPFYRDESKVVQFLSDIGINLLDESGNFRSMLDLSEREKLILHEELLKEILANGEKIPENIFKNEIILKNYPKMISDASELATILNACGRLERYEDSFRILSGDLSLVEEVMFEYKKRIKEYLDWVERNRLNFPRSEKGFYIIAKDNIHENFIGTITSICLSSNIANRDIILGFANTSKGDVKISARRKRGLDVNLGKLISDVCVKFGGSGGGHKEAAGGNIPAGKEYAFIKIFDSLINGEKG